MHKRGDSKQLGLNLLCVIRRRHFRRTIILNIPADAYWEKSGVTVAGGNGPGNRLDQLSWPSVVLLDKESNSLIIADSGNSRIVRWSLCNDKKEGEILIYSISSHGLAKEREMLRQN